MVKEGRMRLNGPTKINNEESLSSSTNTEPGTDDMIETENESIRERLSYLEKKVLEQNDEIVCLRSTLADALRRITQLESCRVSADKNGISRNQNMGITSVLNHRPLSGLRYRPNTDPRVNALTPTREPVRRVASHTSSLPQRRGLHYQSTGSLHSDSHSSSSVSPVRLSPSPTPTRPPVGTMAMKSAMSTTNLYTAKKWGSTGDFNHVNFSVTSTPPMPPNARPKSLYNISPRSPSHGFNPLMKHGTRDATYNKEEGSLRMFLRGRSINLFAPSDIIDLYDITKVTTTPPSRLKLDWVYGYRGKDCRSNLYLLPTGEVVYFVAAAAVLYNSEEQSQRHYLGHTDDIKCLAIHPNKLLIATGQTAGHDAREGRPHIRIWNSVSLATIAVIGLGEFDRSISCLSFSKIDGGNLLCAIDEANDHNISVWDWQKSDKGYKITETKCSLDTVIAAEFHPLDKNTIVSCGKNHIYFWTLESNGTLYKKQGIFDGVRDRPKYVTCLAFTQDGDVLSGDSNGNIIVWARGRNTILKIVKGAHEGSVFSICVLKEGSIVSGGGKDGRIVQFDGSLQHTGFEAQIAEHLGGIRALSEGRGSQLLVGSTKNCILIGSLSVGFSPVVLGHTEELWALAIHPDLPQFLTAGFDRIVQLWDAMSHTVVWSKDISEQVQSASFSPDGAIVIIGCVSGKWLVMDSETREVYSSHTDGSEPIQVIKFAPTGQLLALGSRDNFIYIYQVGDDYRKYNRLGRCSGHSSYITHIDWSEDSQYIRSNSGDYELLYWNAGVCRQVPQSSQLRDVKWATNSCTISFDTVGVWPEGADGTDVNACEVSNDKKLLASADDFGKVKLYSYPVIQPKSLCHVYGGHSSHVTNVGFLHDDSRLISVGGNDTAVFQWEIVS